MYRRGLQSSILKYRNRFMVKNHTSGRTWINFNPSMDKWPNKVWGEIIYPFPKFNNHAGMDKNSSSILLGL